MIGTKLFRYVLTGGTAAIVDVGGFALLGLTALPLAVSSVLSFCAAVVVNYSLSSRFVFLRPLSFAGFGLFFAAAVGGMAINVSITLIGSLWLESPPVVAKVVGCGVAFLLNFWVNLRVVFRPAAASAGHQQPRL
jgi:putative flippase GtrA